MLVGLADDVLLLADEGGELVDALHGLAILASWHLEDVFAEGADVEEIDIRGGGIADMGASLGVVGKHIPVGEAQFVQVEHGLIDGVARVGRGGQGVGLFGQCH